MMAFEELDYQNAAKLYDNLNSTACFYTTALRILSKANWQERIKFDNHIGHQALIAVAHGWTTAFQPFPSCACHVHTAYTYSW